MDTGTNAGQESAKYTARVTVPFRSNLRGSTATSTPGISSSQPSRRGAPEEGQQSQWPRWPVILAAITALGILIATVKYAMTPGPPPEAPLLSPPPPLAPAPPAPVHYECLDGPHTGVPCCKPDWSYLVLMAAEGTSTRSLLLVLRRMLRAHRPTIRMCLDGNLPPDSAMSAKDFSWSVMDHFDFGCPGIGTHDTSNPAAWAEARVAEVKARVARVAAGVQPLVASLFPEECHFLNVRYDYAFVDDVLPRSTKNGGLNVLLPLRHPVDRVVASFQEWERLVYGAHVPDQLSVTGLMRFSSGALSSQLRKWMANGGIDRKPPWMPRVFADLDELSIDGPQIARFAAEGPNYMTRLLAGAVTGTACGGASPGSEMSPEELLAAAKQHVAHMCLVFVDTPEMGVEYLHRRLGLEGSLGASDDGDGGGSRANAGGKHGGLVSTLGTGGVISRDVLDVIIDDNALDMELFSYATELFQREHASLFGEKAPEVPGSNCLREVELAEARGEPILTPEAWATMEAARVQAAAQRRREESDGDLPRIAVYNPANDAVAWRGAPTKADTKRPDVVEGKHREMGPMHLWHTAANTGASTHAKTGASANAKLSEGVVGNKRPALGSLEGALPTGPKKTNRKALKDAA